MSKVRLAKPETRQTNIYLARIVDLTNCFKFFVQKYKFITLVPNIRAVNLTAKNT